jgi:hypothetical protein
LKVGVIKKFQVQRQTIMLPQQCPAALPSTGQVAQDWQSELFQWRLRINHFLEARNDTRLSSFFLSGFV